VHASIVSEESDSAMIALHPVDVVSKSPYFIAIALAAATKLWNRLFVLLKIKDGYLYHM
jgi:hypothetical protein